MLQFSIGELYLTAVLSFLICLTNETDINMNNHMIHDHIIEACNVEQLYNERSTEFTLDIDD